MYHQGHNPVQDLAERVEADEVRVSRENHDGHYDEPSWSLGFFFYPGFYGAYNYGYWGLGADCGPYCYASPFYSYGFPYVYAPRTVIVQQPSYTYTPVPYGSNYYLSQGNYTGLNAAINDIRNGWLNGNANQILRHVDTNQDIAVYLNGNYSYSLPGSDFQNMVKDAMSHIRTTGFTIDNLEQRSDGAYTVTGTHSFYDVNNNYKTVRVSYTLAPEGSNWVIVSAGSSE